ncbi:hypothetical protein ACQ33O_07945 [Ferruginibacter sp. SUN002]|uniref:hypothetical protein n=1 Tax=Ferruginibacter sp. SUN002 TaxID=2937789 RepID=UPI003D362F48
MLKDQLNTKEILLQTVKEHPYFAPAQFLLLQQTDKSNENYQQQIAKTNLLFNNALWLNFQLLNYKKTTQETAAIENIVVKEEPIEETIIENNKVVEEESANNIRIDLKLSEPVSTDEKLLFEPLHTSDYFASQGIKLSEEIKPDDKLGKQLKSFTEWLKTMKKVHVEEVMENNGVSEIAIQNMAERSNAEDVILTEAMADVLIQQGKTGKAIEVYQKLSLLNPSKSAYFAAKIEQFKG